MNELQEFQTDEWLKAVSGDSSYKLSASDYFTSDEWYLPEIPRNYIKNEWKVYNDGNATGTILGGNLNTLMLITGTSSQIHLHAPIAFLENAEGEDYLDWDRELAHFLQIYPDIAGLVIGRFPKEANMTGDLLHFILDKFPQLRHIPVIYDVDFGHTQPIFTFPLGGDVEISTDPLNLHILRG